MDGGAAFPEKTLSSLNLDRGKIVFAKSRYFEKNPEPRKRSYVLNGILGNVDFWGAWNQLFPGTCAKIHTVRNPTWGEKYSTPLWISEVLGFSTRPLEKLNPGTAKSDIFENSI